MCMVGDLEPCEVWDERERKARKAHTCSCCYGQIRAGEVYVVHFSVFEGQANSEKMCKPCHAARAEFAKAHDGSLCSPSYFGRMLMECIGENGEDDDPENKRWVELRDEMDARGTVSADA